jgi:hypothetical protein
MPGLTARLTRPCPPPGESPGGPLSALAPRGITLDGLERTLERVLCPASGECGASVSRTKSRKESG